MADVDWTEFPIPTLMRSARGVYAQSIRVQLQLLGVDDLPRNGAFILAGIDAPGGPQPDLPAELGVTKQAVSQLVDVLVTKSYLERRGDAADRRRVVLELTDRGREVVAAVQRGVDAVDQQLAEQVPSGQIDAMRSALIALTGIKGKALATGAGRRRPARQLRRFSPIFSVRDLRAALAHYAALGFDTAAYEGGDDYGFASRDGVELHLAVDAADPEPHPGAAYLYVRDADALYEQWSQPALGGHTHPVGPTAYKLREGSHVDPDGNLIRFGSPIEE
jgi:DNA-binding MarR family transcriptional regulator/catechol 2,3-dioxygenase-like lactoylglutathione lyase family enzyme